MKTFQNMGIGMALCLLLVASAASAAPGLINYSGRLTDNAGAAVTNAVTAKFSFWSAPSGGTQLGNSYEYTQTVTPNADGLYSISIGDSVTGGGQVPSDIFDANEVWLNVNIGGEDLTPRARINSVGYALRTARADSAAGLTGTAYVTAPSTGTAAQNGAALLAAYEQAKALKPNDEDRSTTNRAVLLVSPGQYDLGSGALRLDAEFVDLVGLSTARDNQYIYGWSNGYNTGVLEQTANNVRIENLVVDCRNTTSPGPSGAGGYNNTLVAAYFPDNNTTNTVIRNTRFNANGNNVFSSRLETTYAGYYENCVGGGDFLGGSGGTASGTFINCTGGIYAFGGFRGKATGTFKNCVGGIASFGGDNGLASGTFISCTGGANSFGALSGIASGTFINCSGGAHAFGGFDGTASGTFEHCTGGNNAFGGNFGNTNGGTFRYCTAGAGGFGAGTANSFLYCILDNTAYP